jgi:hypothetical protein
MGIVKLKYSRNDLNFRSRSLSLVCSCKMRNLNPFLTSPSATVSESEMMKSPFHFKIHSSDDQKLVCFIFFSRQKELFCNNFSFSLSSLFLSLSFSLYHTHTHPPVDEMCLYRLPFGCWSLFHFVS